MVRMHSVDAVKHMSNGMFVCDIALLIVGLVALVDVLVLEPTGGHDLRVLAAGPALCLALTVITVIVICKSARRIKYWELLASFHWPLCAALFTVVAFTVSGRRVYLWAAALPIAVFSLPRLVLAVFFYRRFDRAILKWRGEIIDSDSDFDSDNDDVYSDDPALPANDSDVPSNTLADPLLA